MATQPASPHTAAARPPLSVRPFFENKSRAFWTLQAAGWTGYLVLRGASAISNGLTLDAIIPIVIEAIVGYCLTLLLSALYGYYRTLPRVAGLLLTVVTLGVATLLYAFIDAFSFSLIRNAAPGVSLTNLLGTIYVAFTVIAGWSALYFGINFYLIVEEQIDQMQHLETQASSAQLAMLRYQLNPHFLFNTLNSISTLVLLKQTERANAMLSRLSSFLRYTLANEPTAHVTVAQEVETLKLYLEIEKMRFEDRLRPVFDIDPRAERARLPSLLLQPLVENAIKYAVTPQEDGAEICLRARLAGDRVQIAVTDTGPGLNEMRIAPSLSTGVGLANIRERLVQAYGADQRLDTRSRPEGGFSVEIEIPFQLEDVNREVS
ncbi:Histidine kinase-, DNA gyrase B-, and HSP90-like ATPase [Sphingomonas gellani]|uniref:Histidine kinase-, DNA gyrase B-, and HSP90-like ATPase n=1 Tax=Sphingomonas gellani TaxID=1166340 RepID=A0A1H8B8E1_9SPHN|nr:sensor histidine kinase [Sphingomonas gellani]SEM79205.1 Histidine kinase-, DNA gyrase B-, and HSP90-like ATPase [Sphingomonas gellani]